jgi:MoaA/NifB/PqqE/SkfB family radical SAM enzyme
MLVHRHVGKVDFAVDSSQSVGICLKKNESNNLKFINVNDFIDWALAGSRIPAVIEWELLSVCNFKCRFCYMVGHTEPTIFSSERAFKLIDEFVDAGVVQVILTGGECLIHPNFTAIYEKLRLAGIIVSVFTNLEKLTAQHIEIFKRYPPYVIEVSIYGHDEDSYERVTGRRAFKQVLQNIEILRNYGFNILCKTPITTLTQNSIDWIYNWCKTCNLEYFSSASIYNGRNGDDLSHFSLQGEEYYSAEKFRLQLVKDIIPSINLKNRKYRDPSLAFSCGAGKVGAYINYDATLSPCAGIGNQRFNLMELSFADAWQQLVNNIQAQENLVIRGCNPDCSARAICKMCPAVAVRDEKGNYRVNPDYCEQKIALAKALSVNS